MVLDFYAASYGAAGFASAFPKVFSPDRFRRLYIIKGGPGTGKSTFMKRLGARAENEGMNVEYYHCSSDPSSLDGVIIPDMRCAVIDGTAPHTTDPIYPAAADSILNFGAFIDVEKAGRERERIVELSKRISESYSNIRVLLSAAKTLYDERTKETEKRIIRDKLKKCALKFNLKSGDEVRPYASNAAGETRWISSSVPGGGKLHDRIFENYRTYTVSGRRENAACFIENAAGIAERSGKTVVRCPAPGYGGLEAVLIAENGIAYIASEEDRGEGKINADRFFTPSKTNGYAKLCKKIERRLLSASDAAFTEISRLHGELEEIYGGCTDFESLTEYTLAAEEMIFRSGGSAK